MILVRLDAMEDTRRRVNFFDLMRMNTEKCHRTKARNVHPSAERLFAGRIMLWASKKCLHGAQQRGAEPAVMSNQEKIQEIEVVFEAIANLQLGFD